MTVGATATDLELVGATRDGDDRAFEELYARYRKRISGYCYRFTHDHDRAEDVTQEVFMAALRRLRETDRPIVFRPWLFEIARNACIDEHRRRSRVREIPIERHGEMEWSGRSAPSPEVAIESKQRLEDLRGAFRGLSERHHQIIVLRELEGLSYSQIGDRLGMSKIVVESTLFRARRRLTEEYEDLATGRRCEHVLGLLDAGGGTLPKRLGLRERRTLSHHLAHCQSCRRQARDVDLERLRGKGLAGKVAALLPIPVLRLPGRLFGRISSSGRGAAQAAVSAGGSLARFSDATLPFLESGRAAVTAVTLLAAVGGGIATGLEVPGNGSARHPAPGVTARPVAAIVRSGGPLHSGVSGMALAGFVEHGRGGSAFMLAPGTVAAAADGSGAAGAGLTDPSGGDGHRSGGFGPVAGPGPGGLVAGGSSAPPAAADLGSSGGATVGAAGGTVGSSAGEAVNSAGGGLQGSAGTVSGAAGSASGATSGVTKTISGTTGSVDPNAAAGAAGGAVGSASDTSNSTGASAGSAAGAIGGATSGVTGAVSSVASAPPSGTAGGPTPPSGGSVTVPSLPGG